MPARFATSHLAVRRALAALVGVLLLSACGSDTAPPTGSPDRPVRVGSANFAENRLLAEIYALALEDRGVRVDRRFGAGPREVSYPALLDGSLDLVPEYTGNLLLYLDPETTATKSQDVDDELAEQLPSSLRLMAKARAQDTDSIVVTRTFADEAHLRSIDDLRDRCPGIVFGAPPEFRGRPYGDRGLQRTYGCSFREYRPLDEGGPLTVAALREGTVQAADLFSSDPAIRQNGFVPLADPRSNFLDQSVVPLITSVTSGDPRIGGVLNEVSQALDTTALVDLNQRLADPSRPDPSEVARDWLLSVGIIR